jgi:hypothetical protein
MLNIRIVSASALAAIAVALTVNAAAAQTGDTAGQPLPLLAGLHPPHTAKTAAHVKPVHRKIAKLERKHVVRHSPAVAATEPAAPPAQSMPVPDNAWLSQSAPDNTIAAAPETQPPAATAAAATSDATPNAIVMNGQTVEIASPDDLNAIDRAAEDNRDARAATPVQTVLAAPVHDDASAVGSVSWIAQVLAALGGAMAAGVTAWFMIGPGPQRMYG